MFEIVCVFKIYPYICTQITTKKNRIMKTFKNNGNFATVQENKYGEFIVMFGYENAGCENDAYGQTTCTDRKVYKSEKMAIKKAQEYVN